MPNKKINELPVDTAVSGSQLMAIGDPDTGLLMSVTLARLNGVVRYTVTGDANYVLADNTFLDKIIVDDDEDIDLLIGTSPGSGDIKTALGILAGEPEVIEMNLYNKTARLIYLSGITGTCNLIFIYKII